MRAPFPFAPVAQLLVIGVAFLAVASAAQRPLDGLWQSEGYGYVFEVSGSTLKAFEVTTTTSVPSFVARKRRSTAPGSEATFVTKDDGVFFIRTGVRNDCKLVHQEETVPDMAIRRVTGMPDVCRQPTPNTPSGNFEVFAQTWTEHYISFERRKTDWKRVVAEYRQKVHSDITPQQFFTLLEAMIEPMGDLHSYISAPTINRSTKPFWRQGTDRIFKGGGMDAFVDVGRWTLFAMTDLHLQSGTKLFCNRGIYYGHLDDRMGYLRIRSFGDYATGVRTLPGFHLY